MSREWTPEERKAAGARLRKAKQDAKRKRALRDQKDPERVTRPKRVPLGVPREKLRVDEKLRGKKLRFINDSPGRIPDAQLGSYEFVDADSVNFPGNTDEGKRVSRVVGRAPDGTPLRSYLMAIDEELYEHDQREKENRRKEIEGAIFQGRSAEVGNAYTPRDLENPVTEEVSKTRSD